MNPTPAELATMPAGTILRVTTTGGVARVAVRHGGGYWHVTHDDRSWTAAELIRTYPIIEVVADPEPVARLKPYLSGTFKLVHPNGETALHSINRSAAIAYGYDVPEATTRERLTEMLDNRHLADQILATFDITPKKE